MRTFLPCFFVMKKLALLSILFASLILVGCGAKTTTPPTADAPAADTMPAVEAEPTADAAPTAEVNIEQTTKLAECLTEKGVVMYGTEWCGHCKNQKALFGDAFAKAKYVDCDAERQTCLDAGVRGFPTWIDAAGNQYPGTQQLAKLAEIGGCAM
jgi:Thioredoxin